jgi:hypothetical protein
MRKYYDGKVYDTERATLLAEFEHSYYSQYDWYHEQLYRKRTGEYFLYGEGHAASPYCTYSADGGRDPGEKIRPMTYDEARAWAERNLDVDDYDRLFGVPEDDDDKTQVLIRMQQSTQVMLKDAATKEGTSMSAIVERLVREAYEG